MFDGSISSPGAEMAAVKSCAFQSRLEHLSLSWTCFFFINFCALLFEETLSLDALSVQSQGFMDGCKVRHYVMKRISNEHINDMVHTKHHHSFL